MILSQEIELLDQEAHRVIFVYALSPLEKKEKLEQIQEKMRQLNYEYDTQNS